ncbi:MAG: molybdate ABC transporter substrate-binding protein [Spirochaetia bacterium]|jgi:molybdate transport system substrate-binding protein
MKKRCRLIVLLLAVASASFAQQHELMVSAAASLTDVLSALTPQAEAFVGARVLYNFGGSGTLGRQIEEGAPVDVFFSAAAEDMDRLERNGMIEQGTRTDLLSNAIVLVADMDIGTIGDLDGLRNLLEKTELLAIGNPDTVPAGRYAVQALTSYGLYRTVEKKLVLGGTVREVLQYVQSGSAPLGIVFATDALSSNAASRVRQVFAFPESALETPILYPIAVVKASKNKENARKMIEFLRSAPAKNAFRKAGFVVE